MASRGYIELAAGVSCIIGAGYLYFGPSLVSTDIPTAVDLWSLNHQGSTDSKPSLAVQNSSSPAGVVPAPMGNLSAAGRTSSASPFSSIEANKPSLFDVKIGYVPPASSVGFDGPVALKNTVVGEVLDVLNDKVGPHGAYHLCR